MIVNNYMELSEKLNYETRPRHTIVSLNYPNLFSIIWMIICIKIVVVKNVGVRNYFDYAIWGLACGVTAVVLFKKIDRDEQGIIRNLAILIFIHIVGLLQLYTLHSIMTVVALICISCYIYAVGFSCLNIQVGYARPFYYIALWSLLFRTLNGENLINTIPGVTCFLTFAYVVMVMHSWNVEYEIRKIKSNRYIDMVFLCFHIGITIFICWKSNARTAAFTGLGIVMIYIALSMINLSERALRKLFWIVIISLVFLVVFYININSFSWFEKLNTYSVSTFGKRLDNERIQLWQASLSDIKWWQIIIGKGTGKLPDYGHYQNSSFHNSYIQLFMQTGLIGLSVLIALFMKIWNIIVRHPDDKMTQMVVACFVGILVYNCFECTLFQNKAFMGMIEWSILSLGITRSRRLDKAKNI